MASNEYNTQWGAGASTACTPPEMLQHQKLYNVNEAGSLPDSSIADAAPVNSSPAAGVKPEPSEPSAITDLKPPASSVTPTDVLSVIITEDAAAGAVTTPTEGAVTKTTEGAVTTPTEGTGSAETEGAAAAAAPARPRCDICATPTTSPVRLVPAARRSAYALLPSIGEQSRVCGSCASLLIRIDTARKRVKKLEADLMSVRQQGLANAHLEADQEEEAEEVQVKREEEDAESADEVLPTSKRSAVINVIYDADFNVDDEAIGSDRDSDDVVDLSERRRTRGKRKAAATKAKPKRKYRKRKSYPPDLKCPTCDKRLATPRGYYNHLLIHSGEKAVQCEGCDRRFPTVEALRQHSGVHEGKYTCELCGKRYSNQPALSNHKTYKHFTDKLETFTCEECGKQFLGRMKIRMHIKTAHPPDNTSFVCTEEGCGKTFRTRAGLTIHMGKHSGRTFVCDQCPALLASKAALQQHCISQHGIGAEAHPCPQCPRKFLYKSRLIYHMNTVHVTSRDCVCDKCGNAFGTTAALTSHQLTHTQERPFACDQCSSTYKRKSQLTKHMKYAHTKESAIRCHECGRIFQTQYNLQMHARSHTGEAPHACHLCSKRFMQHAHLRKHLKTHSKPEEEAVAVAAPAPPPPPPQPLPVPLPIPVSMPVPVTAAATNKLSAAGLPGHSLPKPAVPLKQTHAPGDNINFSLQPSILNMSLHNISEYSPF